MPDAIGFDVYGTLVDPLSMNVHLQPYIGDLADHFAATWRSKQLEYSFRRGLMDDYQNFDVCTRDALIFTMHELGIALDEQQQERLLDEYLNLDPYPDVKPGIRSLRDAGHQMVAFSNGAPASLREILSRSGALDLLDDIVSVDEIGTFKPRPAVYQHLASRLDRDISDVWLVSSNYWDVMGAKHAGLRAAWVKRNPTATPDPWGTEPDLIVANLKELTNSFGQDE